MNCAGARSLLQPYADGELETSRILELEQHFRACPACALAADNLQRLKQAMRQEALYFPAPASLRHHVQNQLRAQVPGSAGQKWNWRQLLAAMSGAVVACLALLLVMAMHRPSTRPQLAQEIVASHIRSLMASHALDVVSTDQHTVKPWFNGKLDFSPPVKDLTAQGFPLAGGRLDYFDGHTVAALVFQRHKHVINLFIWPAAGAVLKPAPVPSIQGYNIVHWADGGMDFWAISDLNEKELLEFGQDFATPN